MFCETTSTESAVLFRCSDIDGGGFVHETVRSIGGVAAKDADGEGFGNVLGDRHEIWDRPERAPEIVLVKTGNDDSFAVIGEGFADFWEALVEELPFIDGHDFGIVSEQREDLVG